jgi:fatty-acyl-CoA synthase
MRLKKIPDASNFREYPLLIKSLLANSLIFDPGREIVYRDRLRMNYHTFNARVRRLANALENLGLDGGETVGVMDYDSNRYLECYFAVPMTGNVLHCINWRLSPDQILFTINHAEDLVLIVHEDFLPLIEKFAGAMPTVRHLVVINEDGDSPYESLLAAASPVYDFPDFDEDAVATTYYTTGTTGDPKGVYFSHRQLVLHTLMLALTFGFVDGCCRLRSDDVYLPMTPMFHAHAWGVPFLATMYSMKQVYPGKLSPAMISLLIEKEKPTFSHGVPTILQMVLTCPEAAKLDLTGWKVMVGGSALPRALARMALERGLDVMVGYGMSETCPVTATAHLATAQLHRDLEWQLDQRTRTGIPVCLTDIQVLNDEGQPVTPDDQESGEIVVRAPWCTHGYVREPEKGALLWRGGYLHTGDVATIDARHSLRVSDRLKDVIKSGGEWISSIELESLIGLHPAIAEVAVVAVPHPKWIERPYALVVLKKDHHLTPDILMDHIRQFIDNGRISKWALPEHIALVDAIPKTSVGKIDKKLIRSRLV